MKYFAKYLPVEGEIRIGDKVISGNIKLKEGWNWGYHDVNTQEAAEHFNKLKDLMNKANVPESVITEKVKLFLCTRDIQVGDKDIHTGIIQDDGTEEIVKEVKYEHQLNFMRGVSEANKTELFKVIGEISPEATWVKEGDEFDEENVCLKLEFSLDLQTKPSHNSAFAKRQGNIWAIKGPCGHFH